MEHVIEEAQAAEAAGFNACFITEHHQVPEGYFPSPLVVAAAVAARTTRIGIGTAVHLLSLTHPVHVAEDAAMVDIISKGRLILGLGMGYSRWISTRLASPCGSACRGLRKALRYYGAAGRKMT